MNSKQLQNQSLNGNSQPISNLLPQSFSQPQYLKSHLTVEDLNFMQQPILLQLGEFLQNKIYKKLIERVTIHTINAMQRQKVLQGNEKFNQSKFLEDLNNSIKKIVDRLDVWINFNIIKRPEIVNLKKAIIARQEKKKLKCQQIDNLLMKIIQKRKDKTAQQIINHFHENRKHSYVRFIPDPEIQTQKAKINKLLSRKPDNADIEFQKAEEKIRTYKKKMQEELGSNFSNRFDQLKFV